MPEYSNKRTIIAIFIALVFGLAVMAAVFDLIKGGLNANKNTKPYIDSVITTAILTTEPEPIEGFDGIKTGLCEREGKKYRVCISDKEDAHKGDNMNVKMLVIPTKGERPESFDSDFKIATKVTPEQNP